MFMGYAEAFDGDGDPCGTEAGGDSRVLQDDAGAVHATQPSTGKCVQPGLLIERPAQQLCRSDPLGKVCLSSLNITIHQLQIIQFVPLEKSARVVQVLG